ncbi:redoxin domain-containing protein [Sinomicrobium weinanense]|uniref:Redoxin domain-containing protein n=1 Tax=Sinomicrobium weinanense TaxID=2842200 RepID=A0A926JQE7_9FLAO|nr:redoxin domain-containing protein [Sinomicrobium weinanense]MBC9795393.1 redoxin domain-containing protein [Sinomicrobium weinanense]MBU3122892.1 redoxin domain-containing protein [Sinomicrobium weinanense]
MKFRTVLLALISGLIFSCKNANNPTNPVPTDQVNDSTQIKLFLNEKPKSFKAKTIKGNEFNSKNNAGNYWVIFIYDKGYLKPSESYDMASELNYTYKKFKGKISFIGIIEGLIESENELDALLHQSDIQFNQIDNTRSWSFEKEEQLNYNMYCSPAKIIIDPEGKVIFSMCGGHTETINYKLDSIVQKL